MNSETIDIGGITRRYLHLSPSAPNASAPLLLALHGTSQKPETMRKFSGATLDALAGRIGADLVYLEGYKRAWNDARVKKTSKAQKANSDDVGFVRAVIERFGRPTLLIGYSNGGQLVHRLLREAPGLAIGAVTVAAGLPVPDDFTLEGVAPDGVPVLLVHGTADPVVPYEGGMTRLLGRKVSEVRSALATAESYAPDTEPRITRTGQLERRDWAGVRLVTQLGTGHVIPNRTTRPVPFIIGLSHDDLDLGEEIQEFFAL